MNQKQLHIGMTDFMKANHRASRMEEIEFHGKAITFRSRVIKSKKLYDRKKTKISW